MAIHKENLPPIVKASATQITLASTYNNLTSTALIGGRFYRLSALTLNTGTSGFGGIDTGSVAANTLYYVYLVVNGSGVVGLVMSTSSAPSGFSQYKYIGKTKTFSGSTSLADVNPLFVGDNFNPNGIVSTGVQSWVPTIAGLGSHTLRKAEWRRSNDYLEGEVAITAGAPTGVNATLTIPNSYSSESVAGSINPFIGSWTSNNGSANTVKNGGLIGDSAGSNIIYFTNYEYVPALVGNDGQFGNALFASSAKITLHFRVKILEFSGLFT